MRARAREERTREGAREERAGRMGSRGFGVGGRERDELLPRARRGAARERGPFPRNDRALVSLKRSYFFISFGDPCRRRESRRVRAARFRPFVNELTAAVRTHKATLPWNVTAPYIG